MRRTHLRRMGVIFLSLLMALTPLLLNARLALATDPVRGVEVKVDTSALDASVEAARQAGALVVPTETVVYRMLGSAGTPEFKALLPLFK